MMAIINRLWQLRVVLALAVLFFIYLLPKPYELEKFILFSLIPLGLLITRPNVDFRLSMPVLVWLVLIIYMGVSIIWGHDVYRALQELFVWLSFLGILLFASLYKVHIEKDERVWHRIVIMMFFILLMLHFVAIHFEMAFTRSWYDLLAKNKNYTVSLLTILFPYLLFYKSQNQFVRFTKVASAFLLFNIIIILGVRGALIGLIMLILFKVYTLYDKRILIYASMMGVMLLLSYYYIPNVKDYMAQSALITDYQEQQQSRVYLNKTSIDMLAEHPITGVGIGQWWVKAYGASVQGVQGLDLPNSIYRLAPHNLYTKFLAEIGVIGFLLMSLVFLYPIKTYISAPLHRRAFLNKYVGVWIVYLMLIVFYATAHSTPFYFSGVMFVALLSVGIIYAEEGLDVVRKISYIKVPYVLGLLLCIVWFANQWSGYRAIKQSKYLVDRGQYEGAIHVLQKVYNQNIISAYENNEIVLGEMADYHARLNHIDKAISMYNKALQANPHNTKLQQELAMLLINHNLEKEKAYDLLKEILRVQPKLESAQQMLYQLNIGGYYGQTKDE